MIVRIHLVAEVDPEQWDATYGTGTDPAAVREDVKSYALNAVQQSAAAEETGLTVRLGR